MIRLSHATRRQHAKSIADRMVPEQIDRLKREPAFARPALCRRDGDPVVFRKTTSVGNTENLARDLANAFRL